MITHYNMEFSARADIMLNLPEGSALDNDDLNGPGSISFPRKTGDLSTDFALFKITQYVISTSISDRIKFTRNLPELLQQLGKSSKEFAFNLFRKVIEDQPEVRTEFALQLPHLANVFIKEMDSYPDVVQQILPCLDKMLSDSNPEVVKAACEAAIELTPIVQKDEREGVILTLVLRLTHDEEEENKLKGIAALKDIIPFIASDICEHFVVPEIASLATDPIVKIRKLIAYCVPKAAKQVSDPVYLEKLLNIYIALSHDAIWGVRKCCVEGFSTMIQAYNEETQIKTLQPRFLELMKDKSNSVKQAALLQLGEIIANSKAPLPETILDQFTALSQNSASKGEFQHHCAFYLPGVLQIMGPEAWVTLCHPYFQLCSEGENIAKKSIAASIHEVAKIIGPENASNDLVTVFQGMFLETNPAKNVALENLSNFLKYIKEESRPVFLQYIKKGSKNAGIWRTRYAIAKQLEDLVDLYPISVVLGDIWPVIVELCKDKIAKIRDTASLGLGKAGALILTTGNNTEIIQEIKTFAIDPTYTTRLVFAQSSLHLIDIPDFQNLFGEELSAIVNDPVVNVRIACSLVVKKGLKKNPANEYWIGLNTKLSHDFDADVRSNITGKYEDNRGVAILRPAPKLPPTLTPPILRPIMADNDIEEIISFNCTGVGLEFEVLKDTIRPDWSGFVEDIRIQTATIQELLIES
ncbi:unnamed protein product [Blepharisma stoltei]|uniref:Uncharacterized protein n=1 Tax=Blepharisma stoltei TaxID=1481888 RepID=A0AAU9JXC3_9CILI|nr:unnamed protein product [Blepharisma stoltei]